MTFLHSIILGIIEGITEFLPISSTGHLILTSHLLQIPETTLLKSFEIIVQLGAILAVIIVYWKKLWNLEMIKKLIVAFIPTGIIGLALYKIVKTYLLGNLTVVLTSLFVGGIILIAFEKWYTKKQSKKIEEIHALLPPTETISYKQAGLIGLFQSIAIIPGVSRSAATIIGGLSLGLSRQTIVEFSFLLAVPTMLAAGGFDLLKNHSLFTSDQIGVLAVGFITSFIVALGSIKFLLSYIRKHSFVSFGVYRIVLSVIFALWLFTQ